jgi:hypothetical protein
MMPRPSKLRAVNQGTRYDITGNMRALVREIERGEIQPRDVVILTRETARLNASPKVGMRHYGFGTVEDIHWMLATAQGRIEPQ